MESNEVGHEKGLGGLVRSTTPEPLLTGTEPETLGWFLDYYRAVLVRKAEGLTEAQARATVPPSSLTILGLVRHLAGVEEYWWTEMFLGREAILWVDDDDPIGTFIPRNPTRSTTPLRRCEPRSPPGTRRSRRPFRSTS